MTTKLVGASGKDGREREVIPVPEGITRPKELMVLFNCSYWAARGALKRGYYIVDFAKKTFNPASIDLEGAYKMAWKVYHRKYCGGRLPWYIDIKELVHEGAIAIWERAGEEGAERPARMFYRAYRAMSGYLRHQGYLHRLRAVMKTMTRTGRLMKATEASPARTPGAGPTRLPRPWSC